MHEGRGKGGKGLGKGGAKRHRKVQTVKKAFIKRNLVDVIKYNPRILKLNIKSDV